MVERTWGWRGSICFSHGLVGRAEALRVEEAAKDEYSQIYASINMSIKHIHPFCKMAFFAWLCPPQVWPWSGKKLQCRHLRLCSENFHQCCSVLHSSFPPTLPKPTLSSTLCCQAWLIDRGWHLIIVNKNKGLWVQGISQNYFVSQGILLWVESETPDVCSYFPGIPVTTSFFISDSCSLILCIWLKTYFLAKDLKSCCFISPTPSLPLMPVCVPPQNTL